MNATPQVFFSCQVQSGPRPVYSVLSPEALMVSERNTTTDSGLIFAVQKQV